MSEIGSSVGTRSDLQVKLDAIKFRRVALFVQSLDVDPMTFKVVFEVLLGLHSVWPNVVWPKVFIFHFSYGSTMGSSIQTESRARLFGTNQVHQTASKLPVSCHQQPWAVPILKYSNSLSTCSSPLRPWCTLEIRSGTETT
jgi:hypothetical protein